jgi:hypothetical protein
VRGLFKGLASPVIGNVPIQAICFGAYGAARRAIYDLGGGAGSLTNYNQQPLHQVALAGGFAGFANCFISTPTGELLSYSASHSYFEFRTRGLWWVVGITQRIAIETVTARDLRALQAVTCLPLWVSCIRAGCGVGLVGLAKYSTSTPTG